MHTPRWFVPLIAAGAFAYNAPVDSAGPLTVRLQTPALGAYGSGGFAPLDRYDTPVSVPVSLQNTGSAPLEGVVRLVVVDHWKADPATPVPFRLAPHGRARLEFKVQFGPGTHNAHYPIHAYAEFVHEGRRLTAHPVLIVETRIPDLARPKIPAEFQPVPVPKGGRLGLWRLLVRRESAEIVKPAAEAGAAGRESYESASIISYGDGITMTLGPRPPSKREVVEGAAVAYALALPSASPLTLKFATHGEAQYRVTAEPFAGGERKTVYSQALQAGLSKRAEVDLAPFAGSQIRLRFEARGDSEARWAEPLIEAGAPPRTPVFPPLAAPDQTLGDAAGCSVGLWNGSRGLLDAPVGFLCNGRKLAFHGFRVRVAGDDLERPTASTEFLGASTESATGKLRVRHRFRNWAGPFDVVVQLWVERDALRAAFALENAPAPKPWFHTYLEAVSAGPWSDKVERVYAGAGNVIVRPQAFRLGFGGHSMAASFAGFDFAQGQSLVQNNSAIPDHLEVDPVARICSIVTPHAQTLEFFPAANVYEAVVRLREQDTRQPSKGVARKAGRFTFDLWSGDYAESARAIEKAAEYGVRNALVVWHRWQRWGYDYRLPDIYPPNPEYGTLEDFKRLVETCKRYDILFAPHDNYIDFYPDFEGFTYKSIVFRQNGTPFKAWFNYGREAQSYRARPDMLRPYVERNVRLIREGFAPDAYFIDVWASMGPYDYWTEDGRLVDRSVTQQAWGEAFRWIRETLGGDAPQISEAGHDKLIGWLDGADAQQLRTDPKGPSFTWKLDAADSERIPWIDAAWHDKFILHGAGYEGRYQGGLPAEPHNSYSDDYMSTEVLSGRAPMVPHPFNRNVIRKYWLLNDAMQALALDRIQAVEFAAGNIHRQHVRWSKGDVWVNRGAEPWVIGGRTLPQYGFYLKVGSVEAAVETAGGKRVEWSRSPAGVYEDGRLKLANGRTIELP